MVLLLQSDLTASLDTQIKILTVVMGVGTLLVGALIAYLRVSTANNINAAKLQINETIQNSKDSLLKDIKAEFARREMVDAQLRELDRRITRTESRQETLMGIPGVAGLLIKNNPTSGGEGG